MERHGRGVKFNRTTYRNSALPPVKGRYAFVGMGYATTNVSHPATALVDACHAADPNLKVLAYIAPDVLFPGDTGVGGLPAPTVVAGSPYPKDYPDSWYVLDASGNPIQMGTSYGVRIPMNLADSGYRAAIATLAQNHLSIGHFDGIFFDDIGTSLHWQQWAKLKQQSSNPLVQNDANWQSGIEGFLKAMRAALPGKLIFANISGGQSVTSAGGGPAIFQNYLETGIDGAMIEDWCIGTDGRPVPSTQWAGGLQAAAWCEQNRKWLLLNGDDKGNDALALYGLASMMLVSNGFSTFDTSRGRYGAKLDLWLPMYDQAQAFGTPLAPYVQAPSGLYSRAFQHGTVYVNPTAAQITDLGVTLPAHSGLLA